MYKALFMVSRVCLIFTERGVVSAKKTTFLGIYSLDTMDGFMYFCAHNSLV